MIQIAKYGSLKTMVPRSSECIARKESLVTEMDLWLHGESMVPRAPEIPGESISLGASSDIFVVLSRVGCKQNAESISSTLSEGLLASSLGSLLFAHTASSIP